MDHAFRLYGHRGAAAHHPENTMASFAAALEGGADALETDVRLTLDDRVVVFHDADGKRTCGQDALVRSTPWAEVATWDAGSGQHPVLLETLLDAWPDVFVNIDVKDDDPRAAVATMALIEGRGRSGNTGLGSFHVRVTRAFHEARWPGQIALSPREVAALRLVPMGLGARWIHGRAAQIPTHQGRIRLDTRSFIDRMHRAGLRVDFWTIDDPAEAAALVAAGADGIVTNDPAAIAEALPATR